MTRKQMTRLGNYVSVLLVSIFLSTKLTQNIDNWWIGATIGLVLCGMGILTNSADDKAANAKPE